MAESKKLIGIAVDGSEQAEEAFNFYVSVLHRPENSVVLLHCVEQLTMIGEVPDVELYERMLEDGKQNAALLEEKFMGKLKQNNIPGRYMSVFSHRPGEAIVSQAQKEGVSLIVTGTRGLGTLRRTALGSVSDYVIHHAHCPVLVSRR